MLTFLGAEDHALFDKITHLCHGECQLVALPLSFGVSELPKSSLSLMQQAATSRPQRGEELSRLASFLKDSHLSGLMCVLMAALSLEESDGLMPTTFLMGSLELTLNV